MPRFEITSPDGKRFEITAPDGATQDEVLSYAQSQFAAPRQPSNPDDRVSQIPNNVAPPLPEAPQPTLFDKLRGGVEAGLTAASGVVAAPIGAMSGVYKTLTGGQFGTQAGIRQGEQQAQDVSKALTFQPRTATGQEYLQNIGSVIDKTKIAGLGPTEAMALAGTAGPALRQVENAVVAPVVKAIAGSPEMELAKQGVRSLAQTVLPMPKQEVVKLALKANEIGIPLRPDMLTDNKFARMIGEAFEKVPFSGSKAEQRQVAFNRALVSQIGGDRNATRLTPDVFSAAMDQSGSKIGEIASKTHIPLDPRTSMILNKHIAKGSRLPSDIAAIVKDYVDEIKTKAATAVLDKSGTYGQVVPGEVFRKINSELGTQIRSSQGDLRYALSNLQDDLQEILAKNIKNPQDLADLNVARKQYAIGKSLLPLVAKSPVGDISPANLMAAVTNTQFKKDMMARGGGDIGDLARIGQLFLKEPSSSNTAERALIYGGLLGGASVNPYVAGGAVTGANIYNRAAPAMTRGILDIASQPRNTLADLLQASMVGKQ